MAYTRNRDGGWGLPPGTEHPMHYTQGYRSGDQVALDFAISEKRSGRATLCHLRHLLSTLRRHTNISTAYNYSTRTKYY